MNTGIVTFSTAANYGAVLQCFALSEFIKSNGCNTYLIEYPLDKDLPSLRSRFRNFFVTRPFARFKQQYLPRVVDHNICGSVVFGSDQIWNPQITKDQVFKYFGSEINESIDKISYAASFGLDSWNYSVLTSKIQDCVSKFKSISVREASGVDICKSEFGVDAECVLDPTFLNVDYSPLLSEGVNKDSFVTYFFNKSDERVDFLKKMSSHFQLKAVLLNDVRIRKGIRSVPFPTVTYWLSSINNAKFVMTDSFHCMVFSIIFKKQFICFPARKDRAGRMKSLLSKLGLADRYFETVGEVDFKALMDNPIDFEVVQLKLFPLIAESERFLKDALGVSNG